MKTSLGAMTMAAAAMAAAQQAALPFCGQICIQNMLSQGPFLGCPYSDPTCLCSNPNFGYGVRDCAMQSCAPIDAQVVIVHGINYCAGVTPLRPSTTAVSTTTISVIPPTPSSSSYTVVEIDSIYKDKDGSVKISTMLSTHGAEVTKTSIHAHAAEVTKTSTREAEVVEVDSLYVDKDGTVKISTMISTQAAEVVPATTSTTETKKSSKKLEGAQVTSGGGSNQDGPDQSGEGNEYSSNTATKSVASSSSEAAAPGSMYTAEVIGSLALGGLLGMVLMV
ncbi:hypothetical protein QBC38DRAFT_465256 [Podospora fimiseda]|uniref:CFEM domain-containing protein n=1 Tax=Podospora fimiseda TaxID=252190 RepID=A0AAN7BXW6_9PEZI|nr:hypothetical protein QBC38DRAFT_465256 [Podospora fimiseda]